jgi:uncharacterized membrane protein YjgN (DUF898 family)
MEGTEGTSASQAAGRVVHPEFTGSTAEYFRLWVVNLLFTLLTLGVFSAWAKVRKKKYFYGNTRIDGDTPDYFARPEAILKGRIVAAIIVGIYLVCGEIYPESSTLFWAAGLLLLPWLATRALMFNARNSAFRGVRFDFTASGMEAAMKFWWRLIIVAITGGIALPWFLARLKEFVMSRHAYGASSFECKLSAGAYYRIYLRAFGLSILLLMPIGIAGAMLYYYVKDRLAGLPGWVLVSLPVVSVYVVYAIVYAYQQARIGNLGWNNCTLPGVRFECTLGAIDLTKLYFGNLLAIAGSAGLLIPWAVVRTYRYRLARFALMIDDEVVYQANPALAGVGAAGQELGDLLNLDLGI